MTIELVPSLPRHIGRIARHMRAIDRLECWAVWGMDPKPGLRACRRRALWSLTVMIDGQPEALLGLAVGSVVEGRGIPFMLGTDALYKHPRDMIAKGQAVINLMRQTTPILENIVACQNDRAIRMLRRWGFTIETDAETHGGVPFVPFHMGV